MPKPSTPDVWASAKAFSFQPSQAQQAQGFDYISTVRPSTGAPITDDHDWPLNQVTKSLKWVMDQIPDAGLKSAAFKDVGTGPNQIPDMSAYSDSFNTSGWKKTPDGYIEQWGVVTPTQANVQQTFNFVIPFPSNAVSLITTPFNNSSTFIGCQGYVVDNRSFSAMSQQANQSIYWRALGK